MTQEQLDGSTAPSAPDVRRDERSGPSDGPDSGNPAKGSPPPDMHLSAILNAPAAPGDPPEAARELAQPLEAAPASTDDEQHRLAHLARPPAPEPAPAAPSPAPSVLVGQPPLSLDVAPPPVVGAASHAPPVPQRLPVAKLLFTTSQPSVLLSIRDMADFVRDFPDADHLNVQSGRAVSTSYNAQEPNLRAQLWVDWHIFSTLARALGVPVFPIQPAKVALVLATYAEMPLSPVLRHVARLASPHDPFAIPNVFEALNLAAKATRHLWTDVACFIRSADNYEATAVLHAHVNDLVHAAYARSGQPYYGHPPISYPYQHMHHPHPPPPPHDSFTSRPLLTHVPPAAPAPSLVTPPPDQFIQPAHGGAKQVDMSLRSLCEDLPGLLKDMQKETDDLATFELAQERFQAKVNTADFASRVARLHHTAVIYTHVTALLRFPTYPITSRKLAVFALAMTPGPLGVKLDEAVSYLTAERQCPRAPKGKTLEDILTDLTLVRRITFGDVVSGEENSQWARWWKEVSDDWKGKTKAKSRLRDERPVAPVAKRIRRSVSPDSDVSTASTSRTSAAAKKSSTAARRPRSRMSNAGGAAASWNPRRANSATPAPSSAPSSAPTSSARAPKPAGYKKGYAYIAPVAPAAATFPRWVPERKGTLPERRAEPPLPPIMDSPWFVPRKKKVLGGAGAAAGREASVRGGSVGAGSAAGSGTGSTGQGGAEGAGGDGSVEGASDDDDGEEERAKALGRSVALHRPRRGGLDMKPFDVSLLWD